MRHLVLSLVLLSAAVSTGYAQQTSTTPAGGSGGAATDSPTRPDSPNGPYGPPQSGAGHLPGIYGPSRPTVAKPLPSRLSGSANSTRDNIPSVSVPGRVREGEALPQGVQASPMSDRPGYGRARVNGRMAIVDLNGNHIVELLDSPGSLGGSDRLGGVYGPAQSPAQTPSYTMPFSPPLAGSANSGGAYSGLNAGTQLVPGATLPAGVPLTPSPYGAGGYGQALVNGRSVLIDRSTNRIIQILR